MEDAADATVTADDPHVAHLAPPATAETQPETETAPGPAWAVDQAPQAGPGDRRPGIMDPAAGIRRPGLLVATRPSALVTTPWPATIRYRGPLLDYGNVMILEPASGYVLVLAGLGVVYGEVGDVLAAGAPVGLMGGVEPVGSAILAEEREGGGAGRTETLYIELRVGNEPVDPAEWFAETKDD